MRRKMTPPPKRRMWGIRFLLRTPMLALRHVGRMVLILGQEALAAELVPMILMAVDALGVAV